ncbi:[FeFe] hydrogenase H-cluster radical SAM maturase HydE [uncultured Desulfovibrio sp.]|uniref:[FeFe] hydrogenase H-cluster radical SAM maturase HydE n=1 Tax=Candidatus Desulfovibrio intestinavium TaxID=2838534 RepID=A0A9D2KR07_9BACT|nr:[FeFe] hydrogenase H-cluster radical SAM maturase HydE [uncultured Desulfovibrio sp.]HJA78360.1 [FeFe] hydrogenase H-cluster radical SAM maturase HydE [Candidatus Desulfovibrio intestinavium]
MTRRDILDLLFRLPWPELREAARLQRRAALGRQARLRGLLEFSNLCRRNCRYCGLRAQHRALRRYCLTAGEILAAARQATAAGVDTLVLQSGEWERPPDWLAGIIARVKAECGLAVTLSVGEMPRAHYACWREAGADRFLLRHETADAALYARLHPGYRLADRLRALEWLAELGYAVGSGFLVGVPGQRPASLADDILLVRRLNVAMCGVGPFIPQAATPLAHAPQGDVPLTLRVLAVLRLALPAAHLPATTALASLSPEDGQRQGLLAGADVLMPSFTPPARRAAYRIYDHKAQVSMAAARRAVQAAGLRYCPPVASASGDFRHD